MSNFATNGSEPAVFIEGRLVAEITNVTNYIFF